MRRGVVLLIIGIAGLVSACSDASTVTVTAAASPAEPTLGNVTSTLAPTSTGAAAVAPTTNILDSAHAQIARAVADICTLISGKDVALGFAETVPLTTQPMSEGRGPACGYPHPRAGGYLLVIQFQDLVHWDGYAKTGRPIQGLGLDAVVSVDEDQLLVRDVGRSTVVMFLSADHAAGTVDSLLHVAALVYGKAPGSLRVAGSAPG